MAYTPDQLADLEAIRDAARRYCRGVDRLDEELLRSAYWPDATDEHGVFEGNAWDFAAMCMPAHRPWRATMHCIFNHSVDLAGDGTTATGEIYNVAYLFREGGEPAIDVWFGRYLDRYEKRDGEWRIAHRVCVHEGSRVDQGFDPMPIDAAAFRSGAEDRGQSA